jgi:hypothetical protein
MEMKLSEMVWIGYASSVRTSGDGERCSAPTARRGGGGRLGIEECSGGARALLGPVGAPRLGAAMAVVP